MQTCQPFDSKQILNHIGYISLSYFIGCSNVWASGPCFANYANQLFLATSSSNLLACQCDDSKKIRKKLHLRYGQAQLRPTRRACCRMDHAILTWVLKCSCKVVVKVRCNGRSQTLLLPLSITLLPLQRSQLAYEAQAIHMAFTFMYVKYPPCWCPCS